MKRPWLIAVLGLLLAVGGYGALYFGRTAGDRELEQSCGPELAWIRKEFQLSDAEFARVRTLHEAYKPVCAEYCRQIDAKNREVANLMLTATNVTPEIEKALSAAAELKAQCYGQMLKHFFLVSQAMPAEQGRRYLTWMQLVTLAPSHQSMLPQVAPAHHHVHPQQ